MRAVAAWSLVAALATGGLLGGQEPTGPVFRSRVEAVEVELRVLDSQGRPVSDIEPHEVRVLEDGRPQQIVAFTRVSLHRSGRGALAAGAAIVPDVATNRSVARARLYAIV